MEPHLLEHILDGREKPTNLQLALLKSITDNFSKEREIGHGGFATVYKGVLPNGNIAVKRIMSSHTIDEKPFHREVNSLLMINHPNIVRFLGFCASTDQIVVKQEGKKEYIYAEIRERLMCFEYISNGNLQEYITDELRGLDWSTRYRLIIGICNGLHYLHKEKGIYHMDLKPANILLDNDMVPKITDFGLSRLDETSRTLSVARHGTRGYCAPEYLQCGNMSFKSDIYSLGNIIIELVTGMRSIPDNNKTNVLRKWRHRWRKTGKESPLFYQQVTKCINIGLLCQEIDPCKRPFIVQIVRDINEVEGIYSQISNDNESPVNQISAYSEDDMLGIEPLEINFHFERNKKMSCLLQLTNDTDSCIAFEVQKLSLLPYITKPQNGIVSPRSKCDVEISLQPMEEAPQRANVFIVRSTKVIYGLRAKDISTSMFSRDTDNVVDEVNLDVVFDQQLQRGSGVTVLEGSQDNGDKDEKLALSHVGQNPYSPNTSNREAEAANWMFNFPIVGREKEMNELRTYTAKARFSNSRVISVWGIAGVGKSALVKNLFHDRVLHSKQFNEYHWVDVSHPFNLRDFCRSLLSDHQSENDPIKECRELLSKIQCLVIIDDLQSKEEWDSIQAALLSSASASIIIVITTEASIATYCTNNETQVFNVKGLEAAAAMELFRKEVHRKNSSSPLIHLAHVELDGLILKCGGLPKVIVAIAALLATQTVTLMDTVRSLNLRFMHHLETNLEYDSLRGLFGWMSTYFCDCPDSLKPCIFYLSIFPPYCNIRRRRLVRRWIAEGYSRDSDKKSAEEQGEEFFTKLLELSIIQQIPQLVTTAASDTTMVKCQVNGFIREYIVSRRMEQNLVFELGPDCVLTTQRTGRHLIILRDWDRDKIVFESIDFSWLRSMTVYGKWESFFISKSMKLLRVLDLEDALGLNDEDLEKMVKRLRRLKFISFRGCSGICHLPSSLGDLRQLQSLDVRHTSIVSLPENITKLKKLQYIHAGTIIPASTPSASYNCLQGFCKSRELVGVKVPSEVGKLTALHTLGVVNIRASGGKAIVKEIKKLTQLRKLGVSGINRHNSKELFSSISGHVHLESLLVRVEKDNKDCLDDITMPWENLQSLRLYGLQGKLPLLSSQLSKLIKLDLEMATLEESDIVFLGTKLPKLCTLGLRVQKLQEDKLHFFAGLVGCELITFENVKILDISYSSRSLHVTFGSNSMKHLEVLKIDCSSACYRLTGLDDVPELKQILLKGTKDEAIKKGLEARLAIHPNKPAVFFEEEGNKPAAELEELPQSS